MFYGKVIHVCANSLNENTNMLTEQQDSENKPEGSEIE